MNALNARWGTGEWIQSAQETGIYLNYETVATKRLTLVEVEEEAARAAATLPFMERTYTREQLLRHVAMADEIDSYVARGFYSSRSADVFAIQKPYWLFTAEGTSHGTPYNYDTHVPLMFWGWNVRPGVFPERVGVSDCIHEAPTDRASDWRFDVARLLGLTVKGGVEVDHCAGSTRLWLPGVHDQLHPSRNR